MRHEINREMYEYIINSNWKKISPVEIFSFRLDVSECCAVAREDEK